ncbi:small integral membrane protein 5 [Tachyglossus aculeatus]|uniref:small integral membrane protein 5 n=1 Tax=Tachyglossus aculeatus TaxID=9261 RepID=UPI0018F4866F|nr:small integral membrane protein 5 [Tachyglossus aculeatus]XP_038597903.1 small integral membrane protein 5 [Tachyglossus aculeatus]
MAAQGFPQEIQSLGQKFLLRLKQLPQAEPVEIAAFSVILLFIVTLLLLLGMACCCCCCSFSPSFRTERRARKP